MIHRAHFVASNALKFFARRALNGVARAVLRFRSRPFPLDTAATTLVLAPHPDDEILGCGGLMSLILGAGHQIHLTYITDGSASHPGHPGLAARRRAEALAATAQLGLPPGQVEFLNVRDGTLAHLDARASSTIVAQLGGHAHSGSTHARVAALPR